MDAIVALYRSESSDSDSASDAESERAPRRVHTAATDAVAGDGSSTHEDVTPNGRPRKRIRNGDPDEGPPKWKRAFAHVDGNWPSHVRVDIAATEEIARLVDGVVQDAQRAVGEAATLFPTAELGVATRELHMSLSRPFVLVYDQIEPFVDALRAALKWRSRFQITLGRAIVLANDDGSRSFLALQVDSGVNHVVNLVKCVDKCMREFGLQTYYKDPIPHVSIASAHGDALRGALSQDQLDLLNPEPEGETSVVVRVASVRVVIGNKHFHIPLR